MPDGIKIWREWSDSDNHQTAQLVFQWHSHWADFLYAVTMSNPQTLCHQLVWEPKETLVSNTFGFRRHHYTASSLNHNDSLSLSWHGQRFAITKSSNSVRTQNVTL